MDFEILAKSVKLRETLSRSLSLCIPCSRSTFFSERLLAKSVEGSAMYRAASLDVNCIDVTRQHKRTLSGPTICFGIFSGWEENGGSRHTLLLGYKKILLRYKQIFENTDVHGHKATKLQKYYDLDPGG